MTGSSKPNTRPPDGKTTTFTVCVCVLGFLNGFDDGGRMEPDRLVGGLIYVLDACLEQGKKGLGVPGVECEPSSTQQIYAIASASGNRVCPRGTEEAPLIEHCLLPFLVRTSGLPGNNNTHHNVSIKSTGWLKEKYRLMLTVFTQHFQAHFPHQPFGGYKLHYFDFQYKL